MEKNKTIRRGNYRPKRCAYCGRYFAPDHRKGDAQKSCGRDDCKKKRKQEAQRNWNLKNPGYFKGRYLEVKEWRKEHPDYQKNRRRKGSGGEIQDEMGGQKGLRELRLLIPGFLLKSEIQDEIVIKVVDGGLSSGDGGGTRDTRQDGPKALFCVGHIQSSRRGPVDKSQGG